MKNSVPPPSVPWPARTAPAWLAGLLLLAAGCVPTTLNPIYTPADLEFRPELVGTWQGDDAKELWEFRRDGDKGYRLVIRDNEGKSGEFVVNLCKVGKGLFLDLIPDPDKDANPRQLDLHRGLLLPLHLFVRVVKIDQELHLASMDLPWLKQHLEKHPSLARHQREDDLTVLTGSTAELQSFLKETLDTTEAWELFKLVKRPPQSDAPRAK